MTQFDRGFMPPQRLSSRLLREMHCVRCNPARVSKRVAPARIPLSQLTSAVRHVLAPEVLLCRQRVV
jgi:hypothetical protein